eukprot:SAG31_NODE_289_length_18388_cov_7.110504_2_plen_51_part_00
MAMVATCLMRTGGGSKVTLKYRYAGSKLCLAVYAPEPRFQLPVLNLNLVP